MARNDERRGGLAGYLMYDRVSWGAIWGGLLTAIGVFLLLSFLLTAIGITTIETGAAQPGTVNQAGGIAAAIVGLVAFFVGGYIAGSMGPADRAAGPVNGFLVWALANVLILLLAAFGVGQIFGAAGALYDIYRQVGFDIQGAAAEIDQQALVENVQLAAWIGFFALLISALGATLGGWVGAGSRRGDT